MEMQNTTIDTTYLKNGLKSVFNLAKERILGQKI